MKTDALSMATLVELTNRLVDDYDVIDVLTVLSHRCVEAVDVDAAGVMLTSPTGELQFISSSSEPVRTLELFQIHANEGPGVDCIRSGLATANEALNDGDGRWPMFAAQAIAQGFHAVHALPMRLRGRTIGALILFRTSEGPLSEDDMVMARCLADVGTIAIQQHQSTMDTSTSNTQLSNAISSRVIIEQAVGMIRQATSCTRDDAFNRLRSHAGSRSEGLTVIARRIVGKSFDSNDLDESDKQASPAVDDNAVPVVSPVAEPSDEAQVARKASNLVNASPHPFSVGET
jgi:GAF domain-containing protein